jgi:hypothetical protein
VRPLSWWHRSFWSEKNLEPATDTYDWLYRCLITSVLLRSPNIEQIFPRATHSVKRLSFAWGANRQAHDHIFLLRNAWHSVGSICQIEHQYEIRIAMNLSKPIYFLLCRERIFIPKRARSPKFSIAVLVRIPVGVAGREI